MCCALTGAPLALLEDEGWLTDARTAAAGALAAKHALCYNAGGEGRREGEGLKVAVLGAGVQARMQLEAIRDALTMGTSTGIDRPNLRWDETRVWARRKEAAKTFAMHLNNTRGDGDGTYGATFAVASPREAVAGADLVVTTTPSRHALITSPDWLKPGAVVVAVGSDGVGKREISPTVLAAAARVIVDVETQSRHIGELQGATKKKKGAAASSSEVEVVGHGSTASMWDAKQVVTLGDVLAGRAMARNSAEEIVVVDLTGVGAQDAAIASAAWKIIKTLDDSGGGGDRGEDDSLGRLAAKL